MILQVALLAEVNQMGFADPIVSAVMVTVLTDPQRGRSIQNSMYKLEQYQNGYLQV